MAEKVTILPKGDKTFNETNTIDMVRKGDTFVPKPARLSSAQKKENAKECQIAAEVAGDNWKTVTKVTAVGFAAVHLFNYGGLVTSVLHALEASPVIALSYYSFSRGISYTMCGIKQKSKLSIVSQDPFKQNKINRVKANAVPSAAAGMLAGTALAITAAFLVSRADKKLQHAPREKQSAVVMHMMPETKAVNPANTYVMR